MHRLLRFILSLSACLAVSLCLHAAPPSITTSTETVAVSSPGVVTFPSGRQLVQTFTSATRSAAVPVIAGQLGWETDTGLVYRATGTSVGNWTSDRSSLLAVANTWTGLNQFTGGLESYWGNVTNNGAVLGLNAGITSVSADPVAIGFFAVGGAVAPGASVIGVGRHAGYAAKGGNWVAIGHAAGQYAHTADNAVMIGYLAGRNSSQQSSFSIWDSVMIGHNAGAQADSAAISVMIGADAGLNASSAVGAVMLGYSAGSSATTATNAVFIGRQAGSALTSGANRLIIDGNVDYSTTTTGLIYGEFDNRKATLNGRTVNLGTSGAAVVIGGGSFWTTAAAQLRLLESVSAGSNYIAFQSPDLAANVVYTLPAADGSSGQMLSTNGSGLLSWATPSGGESSGDVRKTTFVSKNDTASITPGANTWATVWTVTYTPSAADSIIVIRGTLSVGVSVTIPVIYRILNGSTALTVGNAAGSRLQAAGGVGSNGGSAEYYGVYGCPVLVKDTPASTAEQTYNIQLASASGGATLYLNRSGHDGDAAWSVRAISALEIVEVAP